MRLRGEIGEFTARAAGETEGPELWPAKIPPSPRNGVRPFGLEPQELAREVGGTRHERTAEREEWARCFDISRVDCLGHFGLVVDHRHDQSPIADEGTGRSVTCRDDCGNRMPEGKSGQSIKEPGIDTVGIDMEVGRAGNWSVGERYRLEEHPFARCRRQLDVGLPDIKDGNGIHHLAPGTGTGGTLGPKSPGELKPPRIQPSIITRRYACRWPSARTERPSRMMSATAPIRRESEARMPELAPVMDADQGNGRRIVTVG